jgi:hypothetical protein
MRDEDEDQDQEPEHTRFYHLDHNWSFDREDHLISVAAYKPCNQDCNPDGFASIRIAETA